MKYLILMLTSLLLTNCVYKVKELISPVSFIAIYPLDTTKIRFDGFYNTLDTTVISRENDIYFGKRNSEIHSSLYPVTFNCNKRIYIHGVGTLGDEPFTCEYYRQIVEHNKLNKEKFLGNYTIKNDSIYAYSEVTAVASAGRIKSIYCNYRGYLKNKDTIIDWKITPPYPKDFTKFMLKQDYNKRLFAPQTLYFVKTDAVKCLQMD